jgi:prophage antirepressor-like protein
MQELFNFTPFASSGDGFNLSATVKDGEPWFIAADVCRALGLDRSAVRRLDDDEKGVRTMHTPGGPQSVGVINESGLYSLIFSSRKESAKRFKKWVTSDVLPSLRKHGGYINGQEALRPEAQAEVVKVVHEAARRVRSALGEEHRDRHRLLKAALR